MRQVSSELCQWLWEGFLLHRRAAAYCDLPQVDARFLSSSFHSLSVPPRRRHPACLSQDRSAFATEGAARRVMAPVHLREEFDSLSQRPRRRRGAQSRSLTSPSAACRRRIPLTARAGTCSPSQASASTASCHAVNPSEHVDSPPLRRVSRLHCAYVLWTPLAFLDFISFLDSDCQRQFTAQ